MSTSGPDADSLLDRASGRGLGSLARQGVGGWFLALSASFITGTQAVFDVLIIPIQAFTDAIGRLIEAIFGSPADIVIAGADASADSIGPGGEWAIGPFSFAIGVGSVLLAGLLIARYLQEDETSDLLPFTFSDFPGVGVEEDEES